MLFETHLVKPICLLWNTKSDIWQNVLLAPPKKIIIKKDGCGWSLLSSKHDQKAS